MIPFLVAVAWPAVSTGVGLLAFGTLLQDKVAQNQTLVFPSPNNGTVLATKTEIGEILLDGMAEAYGTHSEEFAEQLRDTWGIEEGVEKRVAEKTAKRKKKLKKLGLKLEDFEL